MTPIIIQAAHAYLEIRAAGCEPGLAEELAAAKREWTQSNPDRHWEYRRHGSRDELCSAFADLLGNDDNAYQAMRIALDDDWTTIAAREIIAFAERLAPGAQNGAAA
jgi:hypothetical protein